MKREDLPLCTIFLVVCAVAAHTFVLLGNWKTSEAMESIGQSTHGWSSVGVGLAHSLHTELDEAMANVTSKLIHTIESIMEAQESLNQVLKFFGVEVDSTLKKHVSLLQTQGATDIAVVGIMDAIIKAFKVLPHFQDTTVLMTKFMKMAKPILYQVGDWISSFADKIQAGMEAFGNTVDVVQKLFDQVMAQLKGGTGADRMLQQTFNLFDVEHTGFVTVGCLHSVADLYSVQAVAGKKGMQLLDKYDENGDHRLNRNEFANFADDASVPKIMAVVLRQYTKKLSEVAGVVGGAKMRDEVAKGVVKYLQLVASKNLTKVEWIAERLVNGSVPAAFTADLMAELALAKDDPNVLTTADVGGMVMGAMLTLNSSYVMFVVDLMSNAKFWMSEGLNPDDHPKVIQQVANWTVSGPKLFREMRATLKALQFEAGNTSLNVVDADDLLQSIPATARKLSEANMKQEVQKKLRSEMIHRRQTFQSETSKFLLQELLGGVAATDGVPSAAARALKSGVPAVPATLEFAKFLALNASRDAGIFTKMCMDYTSQSSGPTDNFNTQIQGMVKKISGFIDMLKVHSTRSGIDKLSDQVLQFAIKGVADVQKVVMHKVVSFVKSAMNGKVKLGLLQNVTGMDGMSLLETDVAGGDGQFVTVDSRIHQSGIQLIYANALLHGDIDSDALKDASHKLFSGMSEQESFSVHDWENRLESPNARKVLDSIKIPGFDSALLRQLDAKSFDKNDDNSISASEMHDGLKDNQKSLGSILANEATQDLIPSPVWNIVTSVLRELTKVLPIAVDVLKDARTEVSQISEKLFNIFKNFQESGPQVFDEIAKLNSTMWTIYYFLFVPLTFGILYFGCYASGCFEENEDDDCPCPTGLAAKLDCCCKCLGDFQNTQCCLWSTVVLMQIVVLLIFIVSILLTILAGVKTFITAGCSQVYIINDDKVCTETMNGIKKFLATFNVGRVPTSLNFICDVQKLKTCQMITSSMATSTTYTVVGSFAATLFSFELILQTAMLHEYMVCKVQRKVSGVGGTTKPGKDTKGEN